ncbi:MAG: folylpolyglutamate synthase/dihydrofolate synthase family protein [Bacteroidota bacterium]
MTYKEALEYLYSRLPMYQREGKSAYKKDLTNTLALLEMLGNPHLKLKTVHIAGTNGKGTCAHGIAAILQVAGYKTGLYTSPHLKHFSERIKVDGREIPEASVAAFTERMVPAVEQIQPSFFELTVAMAFYHFSQAQVDIAVIETGLGGRLDSTNVISPEVSLITNIGFDHMDLLGDTLEKIAFEKAGIIKNEVPVVIGLYQKETYPVFVAKAKKCNAELILGREGRLEKDEEDVFVPYHKSLNRNAIFTVAKVLQRQGWALDDQDIVQGFSEMEKISRLKGRFQFLDYNPTIIADVSHNVDGLKVLFNQISTLLSQNGDGGRLLLIFGTVKDKDLSPILALIPERAICYWTQSKIPRALPAAELQLLAKNQMLHGEVFENVNDAIESARQEAQIDDIVLVTGSTFVVAEIADL